VDFATKRDGGLTEEQQKKDLEKRLLAELDAFPNDRERVEFKYAVQLRTIWDVYKHPTKSPEQIRQMVLAKCSITKEGKIHFLGL